MKRFQSPLQVLLPIREQQEQSALEHYARSLQQREKIPSQIAQIDQERTLLSRAWREEMREQSTPALELQRLAAWAESLQIKRKHLENQFIQAEKLVQEMLGRMMAARQQREALEKYLHMQRQAYNRQCAQEAQKVLDEIGSRNSGALKWKQDSEKQ